jgi:hypothetical protein
LASAGLDLGTLRYGTQLSRSWSRSDSFTFPIGLSSQWADSGAGFGILPEALRYSSPLFEDGSGKLSFELTLAQNKLNTELVLTKASFLKIQNHLIRSLANSSCSFPTPRT